MRHLPLSAAFFRKISVLLLTASALLRCSESRAQGCDFTFQPANPCPGEAVTFSVTTPQGGHIYIWKFGNLPGVQVGNTVSATFPNHFIVAGQNHQVILKDSVGGMVVCADTMTINVKPGPDPSLTLPVPNPPGLSIDGDVISACGVLPPVSVPVRNNSSTLSFNAGYLLDWGDGSAPLSNFPPNPPSSHTYNTEGFFPIKLTVTRNNGCVLSKTYTFFNGNVPAIGNKTDQLPQNICAPFDYKFDILNTSTNSSGTLYSIVVNGQVIETFTQQDVPSSYTCHFLASSCGEFDPGTGLKNVYAVSIIAENPCDKQISGVGQVKVNGPPTPFIGVSHTNPNCPPVTYTFSDKSIGGGKILPSGNCDSTRADAVWHLSGMPGVDWDLVSGDTLGAAQIRVRYKKPGTYFINMVAANNGNCGTADTTISVTILTPPTIAASVQLPPSNCLPMTVQGSSVAMGQGVTTIWTVTPPPGLPPSCYTINNPNSPNTSITLLCPGTYGIRVRAVNACDDAEWSTTVEVKSKPTLSFTLPSTCEGQPLTLKANNIGLADGGLPVSITWDFPGGSPASVTLPYPQLPAGVVYPGSGPYTISAVAANDCGTATATATVSFGKKPAPAFALSLNPMSGCAPVTAAATDQSQLNAPAATLRRWTLSNTATGGIVSTSSALNPTFPSLPQGQYLLRLELGNSCDTLLAEKTFVVYGKPTLDFKPILNQPCGSGSPLLSFTRTTGGLPLTYSWQFPGATPATSADSLPMPVYSQPGVYTITLSISNGLCGTATATRTFTVSAIPEADVTTTYNGGPRCLPLTLDFGLATLPGVTYERSIQRLPDPSNPAGPAPFTYLSGGPNTAAASVRINDCGIYDFTLSARNDCDTLTWTKRDTFYKAPVLPLPLLSDSAFCQSAKLNFTGKTLDTGCDPSATIAWQFPGGMPPTSSDPNPTVMYSSPDSTRSFTLTATATNGCTSVVATRSFTIDAPEKLTLGAASYSLCKDGAPITLSGQPGGGQWFWKNAPVSATFDPAQYPVGLHTLVYRKGSGACTSQDSISIAVKPLPSVNAGPDDTVCIEKQTLALVAIEPASGGTWSCVEKPAAVTGNIFDLGIAGGGTFTLRLQFTDTATTCSNLDERQVTVLGNTAIQPHDTLYCMVPGTLVNLPLHDLPGLLYFGPAVVQPGNRLNPTFYPKDTVVQVFFTLTNAAGCAYTASIKVALTPPLPPGTVQAGPDDTLCVYGPPLALLGFPANGTWACSGCPPGALLHPAAGVWQFDPKATAPGAGAFQLTYTVGADNCAQSDSRTIVVIAAAPNAGQPQAACKNAPMQTLSAAVPPPAGFSAYWTGVPGVTDTLKGLFAPMLAGEGAHPVSLHWLHAASGCVFSAGKSFVVHPLAGSSFSIQPPYCVGQALDVQNLTPGAASQTWYDNGKPISTQADPAGIQLDSGQHLIRLVSQTAEMCPDSAEQTIVVIAPPTLVSTPDKTQGCPPLWVRFQNQFTSKDTAYYRISAPGMAPYTVPATAADSLYFAAAAQDLTYTVQLVVENKCDKVEKAFSITALSRPDALFGVSYPKPCSGEDMTVLVTSAGTPTKNTLITSTGLSLAVPLNQPFSLQFFTDTLLPVRLLLVSENGCPPPDSAEQTIVVQPAQFQALASIEADSAKLCAGDTVTLRGYALAGADTYWLNAKSGTKQFQDTIQVVVQEGLNEWTFFAEGCGYDSSGVSFFGKKPPVLSVSHLKQVCPGTPVTFGVASSGQVKLDFGDGSFATQFPAQHTYHSPSTTYLLSATATSTEGCAKTWAGSVQTFAQPEAAIQLPDPLCASAPVPVSNIGTGASTCAWQVGDPPVLYDGCSATVVFQKPGLQPLRLSVTSADGCMDDTTRTVFVRESPVPVLDVSPKTAVCTGTTLRFESKSTSATGLKIDFGDGASATGGPVFEHAYAKGGSYTVTLTATKDGLCAATATATVQVYDRPPFALSLTEGCTQALGYTLTVNAPAVRATLVKPDGSRDSSSLTFRYLQPGIHHLLLTSAISGCRADTTLHILPVAELRFTDFPPDTTLWLGDSCLLSASANLTGVAFAWSPTEWLSAPSAPDPMARPLREGVYRYVLSATDARMCAVLDTVVVRVLFEKDPAVLPTAFTPNGDGVYDALRVRSRHAGAVRQMRFLVYDPWGALMFEAEAGCLPNDESPGCAWDGLLRDQPVKPGPYRAEVLIEYLNGTRAVFSQNIMLAH